MKTFALCAASFEHSVRRAAGVTPLLSPPVKHATFKPIWLEGYDFLYIKLHGIPHQPFWYGDHFISAVGEHHIRAARLGNTVVFVANCYTPQSPMLDALFDAGAKAVVTGSGANYAGKTKVHGADMLGMFFRYGLSIRLRPKAALAIARARLRLGAQDRITRDALQFQLYERNQT